MNRYKLQNFIHAEWLKNLRYADYLSIIEFSIFVHVNKIRKINSIPSSAKALPRNKINFNKG